MIGAEERDEQTHGRPHVTRRQALKVGGVVIGAAWAAPVISIIGAGNASAAPRQGGGDGGWGGGWDGGSGGSGGSDDGWWNNTKPTPTPTATPDKTSQSNSCTPTTPPPVCYVVCNYGGYQYNPAAFCFKYDSSSGKYSCSVYNGDDDYHRSSPDDNFKKTFYDNGCWDDKWGSWSSFSGTKYHSGSLTSNSDGSNSYGSNSYGGYQPKSFDSYGSSSDCKDFVSDDCFPNKKKDCDIWVPTCWTPPKKYYCTNVKFFCQDTGGNLSCKPKSYDNCYHF